VAASFDSKAESSVEALSQISGFVFAAMFAASCSEAISQPAEKDSTTVTPIEGQAPRGVIRHRTYYSDVTHMNIIDQCVISTCPPPQNTCVGKTWPFFVDVITGCDGVTPEPAAENEAP
jgi:hypothetical protein